jgi:acyl-CoA reductase-like NAD-dependent aldehyde dehydrogenase
MELTGTNIGAKCIPTLWECDTIVKAQHFLEIQREHNHVRLENFIGNAFVPHTSQDWIESYEPKTGKLLSRVPVSSSEDVQKAVNAAKSAFSSWSRLSRTERSKYMQRIATLIQQHRELFAVWESIDQGKTLERARIEVDRAVSNFS